MDPKATRAYQLMPFLEGEGNYFKYLINVWCYSNYNTILSDAFLLFKWLKNEYF